jgi:hypothetical protein
MQKPLKSRALRNHKDILPVKKRLPEYLPAAYLFLAPLFLARISEPC